MRELRPLQKSIRLFVNLYALILVVDIIICLYLDREEHLISSLILLVGISLSNVMFNFRKYELGICFLSFVFYIIGFFHVLVIKNVTTCYLILMVVPIISALLLQNRIYKFVLIGLSAVLFPLCNYFAGYGAI